jgi:hypothetical protein
VSTYATADDLAAYPGGSDVPADQVDVLLARAQRFLDRALFRYCWYQSNGDGVPTDTLVAAAFRDCVCAQVVWWSELGDSTGAVGAGWGSVSIGSVSMSGGPKTPADSPARQVAPEVADVLGAPTLTPDRLTVGLVIT